MLVLLSGADSLHAQLLNDSKFQIYRSNINTSVTQLRLNHDTSFELKVIKVLCSLCDSNRIRKSIDRTGHWEERADTIFLQPNLRLFVRDERTLELLDYLGPGIDTLSVSESEWITNGFIQSKEGNFRLTYDTYPNGVAKLVIDKYRFKKDEYEIEFSQDGEIQDVRIYRNRRQRRRIK